MPSHSFLHAASAHNFRPNHPLAAILIPHPYCFVSTVNHSLHIIIITIICDPVEADAHLCKNLWHPFKQWLTQPPHNLCFTILHLTKVLLAGSSLEPLGSRQLCILHTTCDDTYTHPTNQTEPLRSNPPIACSHHNENRLNSVIMLFHPALPCESSKSSRQ